MRPPPGVLVIGGGFAGLAAAVRLRDAGVAVTVVDGGAPGGKARSIEPTPGWRVETGPHTFTHRAEAVFRFAERLGVGDRLVRAGPAARARYLVRRGRLCKASVTSGLLGPLEWLVVFRGLFRVVPPEGTVADWMRRSFGDVIADGPGGAATVGIWAARPEEVELRAGFPALARGLEAHGSLFGMMRAAGTPSRAAGTYGIPGGVGALIAAAVAAVGGVRRAHVGSLRRVGAGWVAPGVEGTFDRVVVATEAPAAARLLGDGAAAELGGVRYSPILAVHWKAPDAALPLGFGYLSPAGEGRPILGTLHTSDVFPERCPAGERAFCTMIGGTLRPELADLDQQAATAAVEEEHRALTGRPVRLTGVEVVRHPAAVAIPGPGHLERVARIRAALPPGVDIAGSWMGTGAVPDAITAGEAAAERLVAALRESPHGA